MHHLPILLALISTSTTIFAFDWHNGSKGSKWSFGCDWNDEGNISNERSTGDECSNKCKNTHGCTHFTWTDWQCGTCWLKHFDSPQIAKEKKNAVCGWVNSDDGSQEGQTTRYWDCCKPSCSWPGKANVNSPVTTCAQDGVTILTSNEKSACEGGPSYSCSNQMPFVSNGMAYGFAAYNGDESTNCCACYELTFTSGSVIGQKMIVQVTNTGSDLGSKHFDIQIPGGGVGIFNACSKQWNAPSDGWGRRYGGITTADECNQLPSQLQEGCNWRFGWFKDAQDPNISFHKVSCPSELTTRSGCVRN